MLIGLSSLQPQVGKCHGKGTKILMFDGSVKKIEDIKKSDKIMGIDSLPRKVKNIHSGYGDIFVVTPNKGGESFTCNAEHILSLKDTSSKKITNISVSDLASSVLYSSRS